MARQKSRRSPTIREVLARVHRRLILLAVLLSSATLMVSGVITARGYFEQNLELVTRTISYAVEPAVVFGDPAAMRESIASIAEVHGVRLVELHDDRGRLLVRWDGKASTAGAYGDALLDGLLRVRAASSAIRHNDRLIARIRVVGNIDILKGYLLSGAIIALCCLGITMLAMQILARRMEEGVVAPLSHIAAVAHEVRLKRTFDRRVQPSGIAEIDRFGHDFNALLAELEGWHDSLTEEKHKLEHEATHDPLTGLGNRVLFDRRLDDAMMETARTGAAFALLYVDADRLKRINDVHGHQAGDHLLVGIADRLRGSIRKPDHAFRLGGDEFALILGPAMDRDTLGGIVSRIADAMALPITLPSGESVVPSVSIGVAIYREDGLSPEELLRQADKHMYRDKLRKRSDLGASESNA